MKKLSLVLLMSVCLSMLVANVNAQSDEDIAKAVIAMAKGQWAAENKDPKKAAEENIADDYTEFNQDYPVRLDGKATSSRFYESMQSDGRASLVSDLANVKVQVYNKDVAILTYNYIGVIKDAAGKTTPSLAKSTRVYVKIGSSWKLVHANFAPVTLPEN